MLLLAVLLGNLHQDCLASGRGKHEKDLMEVLFGKTGSYVKSPKTDVYIKALKNDSSRLDNSIW